MSNAKIAPQEETKDGAAPGGSTSPLPKPKEVAEGTLAAVGEGEKKKVNRRDKNFYLLNAQTENYVDDSDLYKPRLTREMRMDYWSKMTAQKARRKPPKDAMTYQEAWMQGDYDTEGPTYPSMFVLQFAIVRTAIWDYASLFMFLLYLVVLVCVYDGLGSELAGSLLQGGGTNSSVEVPAELSVGNISAEAAENAAAIGLSPATMLLPLIFMFLLQIPPALGGFYFATRCNDLVKYKSRTTNFGNWAFSTIFICQAVEYFFYGGANNANGAGKCAYGEGIMRLFGKKEVDLGDLDALYDREQPSDDEDNANEDEYPAGHQTIDQRIEKARTDLEADPENEDLQELVQGEQEVSFLQKIINEKRRIKEEAEERHRQEELAREAACNDWTEWLCLVCNKPNRRPTHPPSITDIFFGSKGVFYKRTFAIIRPRRDAPICHFCGTYSDYKPPLCSGHLFPYNKNPYSAFNKYPIQVKVQAGLTDTTLSRYYNSVKSFFFGVSNNSKSALVHNDWRLRLYLNGRFPETPRQVKHKSELYQVGEYLECKLQKSEWARCQVLKARKNHTYDLRYDPGDEIRLVPEKELRLPPEKRAYAYYVELAMVLLWMSFPVGVLASQAITNGLLTFFPFCISGLLLLMRLTKLIRYAKEYNYAGVWVVFKLSMFYTLPLLLMLIASFAAMAGVNWVTVTYFWVAVKLVSLPVLYVMKPHFCMFGLILFVQTSAGFYMVACYAEGTPVVGDELMIPMAPLVTATLTAMYFRRTLNTFIDVSMAIRPPLNYIPPENPCLKLWHMIFKDKEREKDEAREAALMRGEVPPDEEGGNAGTVEPV